MKLYFGIYRDIRFGIYLVSNLHILGFFFIVYSRGFYCDFMRGFYVKV